MEETRWNEEDILIWKGSLEHLWQNAFEVTESDSGLELRVFLSANDLLATTTAPCKRDIVLTWSGSRAKGSRGRCLVCVKLSPVEQDKALVKNQTASINAVSTINGTWGL